MIPCMVPQALSRDEIAQIHSAMLSILSQTGLEVGHAAVQEAYASYGALVDREAERVRIPEPVIERFLAETERVDPSAGRLPASRGGRYHQFFEPDCLPGGRPKVRLSCTVASADYVEPGTNRVVPLTEQSLGDYVKLGRLLGIGVQVGTLSWGGVRPTAPLDSRLLAWKHGALETDDVMLSTWCPYIMELYQIRAEALGKSLSEVFRATVYVVSPLRLPEDLCEQIIYFHQHGLRVRIGSYITMGGTGPITLAGCLALNLAERVAVGILERVLYGDRSWVIYGELVPIDLTTLAVQGGRFEVLLANLAVIQQAQHYGVGAHPFVGYHTDARVPSIEASTDRLVLALPCILAGGGHFTVGKLATGCSPIQMILDLQVAGALRHILKGFEISDDRLALGLLSERGPGAMFTDTEHTVRYMRQEFWQPSRWFREGHRARESGVGATEVERALEVWHDLMSQPDPAPALSAGEEGRLQAVIDRAARDAG